MDAFPACGDDVVGPCYLDVSDKGGVLYEQYQSCARTDILLPGFDLLPDWFLAITYALTLVWAFFGVAIISDIFMAAIETITALETEVTRKDKSGAPYTITVTVWNATVANLTLMALGSSAPEILLSVIETVTRLGETPGELGPSTIVGSAAFNLLVITAVCIVAVPEGESKSISEFGVFVWTAIASLFAYLWMLIVYEFWTPDEITPLEAWLTLGYMPVFVGIAYLLDSKPWKSKSEERTSEPYQMIIGAYGTDQEGNVYTVTREQVRAHIREYGHEAMTEEEAAAAVIQKALSEVSSGPNSPRPLARLITNPMSSEEGGLPSNSSSLPSALRDKAVIPMDLFSVADKSNVDPTAESARAAILERLRQEKAVALLEYRKSDLSSERMNEIAKELLGNQKAPLTAIQYKMNARNALTGRAHLTVLHKDDDAQDDQKRLDISMRRVSAPASMNTAKDCKLMFASEEYRVLESQQLIRIMVHCDRPMDAKEVPITVKYRTKDGTAIGTNEVGKGDFVHQQGLLIFPPGVDSKCIEIVINEDEEVEEDEVFYVELFDPEPSVHVQRPQCRVTIVDTTEAGYLLFEHTQVPVEETEGSIQLNVLRHGGAAGVLKARYHTQSDTAIQDIDYIHKEGSLVFESGECKKSISIKLGPGRKVGNSFRVCLVDDPSVATKANQPIVSKKKGMCSVSIVKDEKVGIIQNMMETFMEKRAKLAGSHAQEWADQFREAVMPGPGMGEDGEDEPITFTTIMLHYISITWKMGSGGPCFLVSLAMIAGLTYFVGPIASMFGCAVGLSDGMTAIVFVALGTSLPDTFASYQAALESDDADAAIGNVTGSNSVNVFLGLGLPWVIATSYHLAKDSSYITPAGPLAFSVMVFMVCAVLCIGVILLKRALGGELGGRGFMRMGAAVFLVLLWVLYLLLSGLESKGHITWDF